MNGRRIFRTPQPMTGPLIGMSHDRGFHWSRLPVRHLLCGHDQRRCAAMSRALSRTETVTKLRFELLASREDYTRSVGLVGEAAVEARRKVRTYEDVCLLALEALEESGDLKLLAEIVAAEERAG